MEGIVIADKIVAILNKKEYRKGQEYLGTGFFCNDGQSIITCFHVVKNVYACNETIEMLYRDKIILGEIIKISRKNDLALLRLPYPVTENFFNTFLLVEDENTHICAVTVGFDIKRFYKDQPARGISADIVCSGLKGEKLQLDNANHIIPGFSGAPVVTENGNVIGIVSDIPNIEKNGVRVSNLAYAIPVKKIIPLFSADYKDRFETYKPGKNIESGVLYQKYLNKARQYYKELFVQDGMFSEMDIDPLLFCNTMINGKLQIQYNCEVSQLGMYLMQKNRDSIGKGTVVIGQGGTGKTVFILDACRYLLNNSIISVYVPLFCLNWESGHPIRKFLDLYVWIDGTVRELISNLSDKRKLFIMLDGFNEISESCRIKLMKEVDQSKFVKSVMFVISGRCDPRKMYGWEFAHDCIELNTLTDKQIDVYLTAKGMNTVGMSLLKKRMLSSPLMLSLYAETENYFCQKKDNDIILWKVPNESPGIIIWNFMQCQIMKALERHESSNVMIHYIVAVEYVVPYIAYLLTKSRKYALKEEQFEKCVEDALLFFRNKYAEALPNRIRSIKRRYGCNSFALENEKIYNIITNELVFFRYDRKKRFYFITHEHFRDCFAAIHYSNEFKSLQDDMFSEIWETEETLIEVRGFLENLLIPEEVEYYIDRALRGCFEKSRAILTYNVFEVLKIWKQKDFCQYDFSGLQLEMVSLAGMKLNQNDFSYARLGYHTFSWQGHLGGITCMDIDEKKHLLLTGSSDGTLCLWNYRSGLFLQRYTGQCSRITCGRLIKDSKYVLGGSLDADIIVWNTGSGEKKSVFTQHSGAIKDIQDAPGSRIISLDIDDNILIWDLDKKEQTIWVEHSLSNICKIALKAKNLLEVIEESGKVVCFRIKYDLIQCEICEEWYIDTKFSRITFVPNKYYWIDKTVQDERIIKEIEEKERPFYYLNCIALDENSDRVVVVNDCNLACYEKLPDVKGNSFVILGKNVFLDSEAVCVAISPNGLYFAYADRFYTVRVYDFCTKECIAVLRGHNDYITCINFSSDGVLCFCASMDCSVTLWDVFSERILYHFSGQTGRIRSMVYSNKYNCCILGSSDCNVRVFDLNSRRIQFVLSDHQDEIRSVFLSFDQEKVVSASDDMTLRVWKTSSGMLKYMFHEHTGKINMVKCLRNKDVCISCSDDCTIRSWDMKKGKRLHIMRGHRKCVTRLAVSPDNLTCASVSDDGMCKVWDIETGNCISTSENCREPLTAIEYIDNKRCMCGTASGVVAFFSIQNRVWEYKRKIHNGVINRIIYVKEKNIAFSCGADGVIVKWILSDKIIFTKQMKQKGSINRLVYNNRDNTLLSGADDCEGKVWDIFRDRCKFVLQGHKKQVSSLVLIGNKKHCITGSADNTLRVWELQNGKCIDTIPILSDINILNCKFYDCIWENEELKNIIFANGGRTEK